MTLQRTILLLLLLAFVAPADAEWYPFRKTDTGPYGTYVLYDQLHNLFPGAGIIINHEAPSEKFKYTFSGSDAYFVIAPYIDWNEKDFKAVKQFVEVGNVLVLSTYYLNKQVEKWLHVQLSSLYTFSGIDSIRIQNYASGEAEKFFIGKTYSAYMSKYDSTAKGFDVLGTYNNGYKNCILLKKGKGYVVLHTQPYMFSNYHLIKKKTTAYSELFFSSLPGPIGTIYWDEFLKSTASQQMAPLRFIMSRPPLRNALNWAFAGLLLLVLFSLKRRQRVIPVVSPLQNNTVDMVKTVSDMYYFSRRNEVIAKKKIAHWLEYLRTRYNIVSSQPQNFWQSFSLRTGMPDEQMSQLRTMVERFREGHEEVSDAELIRLNKLIDSTYKS